MLSKIRENIAQRLGIAARASTVRETAIIENSGDWAGRYSRWRANGELQNYSFVKNVHAPFTPARRALPMLNLALISSAGAYIDGTQPFDTTGRDGDASFREIPVVVEEEDFLYAARGYDPTAVRQDRNVQIPIDRLLEHQDNNVIGSLNSIWWSLNGFIPNARLVADTLAPQMIERLQRYEVQAALLVPASRLCHQTMALLARAIELAGIPTMMIAVERATVDSVRPPRCAFYNGEFGTVAGKPNWSQYQRRIVEEALRWIEPLDQPSVKKLVVDLETAMEESRGER
ncbi:MAG: glycine/sarcosine/betaine reductase selenoprotein B family protein [Pyrinomonadaceae bacterium]